MLDNERLLSACAARDMGAVFRLLNSRGVSTRRLAAAAEITQGRLYDYMNGKTRVEKLALFEQIADALHIPGHLLGLARRPWEPPTPLSTPPGPDVPGPAANDDDLAAMEAFRTADRQTGGGRLYAAVVRHLSASVAPRLVDIGSSPHVFAAAAALTEMAGWMAHDSGRDCAAASHFARAFPLAQAAGDLPLAAHIAASTSHLALHRNDPTQATHWATVGIDLARHGPCLPSLTARLHTMLARALAASDQFGTAIRSLDLAHAALAVAADKSHPWLSPFDQATLASESALAFADLGRHSDALRHGEQAVALREEGRARSLAFSRITLARLHAQHGDLDAAVAVGAELLSTSPTLGSVRVVRQLDGLGDLLGTHREYGPVREYLARFDEASRIRLLLLADIIPSPRGGSS
ncbi:helix-turn-helix transcriptional regulator [Kitasatospora sp. NBC_01300]|uniref:helix-turn-helix transcriptional regulator n=1 Tax=Kitasatospora sp. NBC_01300 TaxID=2903574 RepID=UPI00352EF91F|nr:helix-turn-helix transcriptional regulator [Kitasatospora sp. NBC_01300]